MYQISAKGIPAAQKIASATVIAKTPASPMLATFSNAVADAELSASPPELSFLIAYLSVFENFDGPYTNSIFGKQRTPYLRIIV